MTAQARFAAHEPALSPAGACQAAEAASLQARAEAEFAIIEGILGATTRPVAADDAQHGDLRALLSSWSGRRQARRRVM